MDDGEKQGRLAPPQIAAAIISIAAPAREKDVVLGDLSEEFVRMASISPAAARRWYWGQAAASAPRLVLGRITRRSIRWLAITAAATLAAVIVLQAWDAKVARNAARAMIQFGGPGEYGPARAAYYATQMLGFAMIGATIAFATFARCETFLRNCAYRLALPALVLFAPMFWSLFSASDDYPFLMRMLQIGLFAPAFFGGAFVASKIRSG